MKRVYLSLGSNLGDRVAHIRRALAMLPAAGIEIVRASSLYKTEPVGFRAQSWFLNCVAEAGTELMPIQLLHKCQAIERALGRRPGLSQGPRPIDIDILLYENAVIHSAALTIPHPGIPERRFVLVLLRELAPNLRHPVTQQTIREMLQETKDASQVVKLKAEV
jgi:2-amino-4-hydroxy-6-hydroxymethyldihydropteridine diphosphokinase